MLVDSNSICGQKPASSNDRLIMSLILVSLEIKEKDSSFNSRRSISGNRSQLLSPAADAFYSDEEPVRLGNISIQTMLTPGHTIGCTSFFWKEKNPENGETYAVAMHGGVGANTMNDEYYSTSRYLTPDLRTRFIEDSEKLKAIHVDIALPSHPNQIEIVDRAGQYTHKNHPYLDDTVWPDFIDERIRQVKVLMK